MTNLTKRPINPPAIATKWLIICLIACSFSLSFSGCGYWGACGRPIYNPFGWMFSKPAPEPFFEPFKYSLYSAPDFNTNPPLRVLIVPTGTESGRYQVPVQFAEALAGAIRAEGLAEVVFPPEIVCTMSVDRILSGQFDEFEIVNLTKAWHCDAVMFIRVNQLQAFAPLKTSVTAALVDSNESVVTFALDGNWDTTDPEILKGFKHYLKRGAVGASESELNLQLQSPSRMYAFVAWQIANAWKRSTGPQPAW